MITTVFETNLSLKDAWLNTARKKLTGFYGQSVLYPVSGGATSFDFGNHHCWLVARLAWRR